MAAPATSSSQHAHWFAEAADVASHPSPADLLLPHSVWASRLVFSMQALAFPLAFWFKPVCLFVALVWLTYRASQVVNKPLDELAALLGFDIPLTPAVDLAGIKADGAVVHWSLPEKEKQKHRSSLKYEVHVNGNVIDTVSVNESAVTITGLQPGSFYVVRIALVNNLEFSSKSSPIRFRTKLASSADFYQLAAEAHDGDQDAAHEPMPRARPYRGLKDVALASPDAIAPPMARDNSTGGRAPKRSITGRRPSPVALGLENKHDPVPEDGEPPEGAETIQQLTEKLDMIRRETDEAERQAKEEEEEESRQKEDFIRERDELKAEVAERDKANRNMKREVNILERQNTAAQNERSKHERLLAQKNQERQKLKEDTVRWEREAEEIRAEVERIKQQKVEHLEQMAKHKEELLQKQAEEAAALKSLDEEIREKTTEIKKLERATKNHSPNGFEPETNLVQQLQQEAEEDRSFLQRRFELQQQYTMAVQSLERAKSIHSSQVRYLESVRAERRRQDEAAAASAARELPSPPVTSERALHRGNSERSRRTMNGHSANNESPRMNSFPTVSSSPFGGNVTSTAFTPAPFLNIQNGMTIAGPIDPLNISDEDREKLTGGAPMSPGAGADLLPADLFSGDDSRSMSENVQPLPGLGALPGLGGTIPGLGQQPMQNQDSNDRGPASPASVPSRSPSVFASPRGSQNNLYIGSPENLLDSDRRSVHSTRSSRAISNTGAGSRFSSMFGIKPRAKNASMDDAAGPPLGKAQSHSMPRQDQGVPGLDSATRKRNSSISGAVFGGVLGRSATDTDADNEGFSLLDQASQPRRRPFNLNPFSKDKGPDGWPSSFTLGRRPASPRPGSTHSNELPRPSFDSSRWGVDGWPSNDAAGGARSSPLSFGGWNAPLSQSRIFGSRHPSRRPSVQHGASGPPEDIMEDEDSDALDPDLETHLAPIGTKPPLGSRKVEDESDTSPTAQRLNPNAKDFKSFFPSMKLRSSRDKDKAKEGEASSSRHLTQITSNTPVLGATDDDSPPNSRKSRDTRSMTTIESSLAESLRTSNDLARTPSYSNASDNASRESPLLGSGSIGKESFMSKITRKSSSGKFSLPNFKREKSRLDPNAFPGGSPMLGAEEEEDMTASASSLREGRESKEAQRGSVRSWSNVLKLSKKKGGETPSVSGLSTASNADDEDEEEGLLGRAGAV